MGMIGGELGYRLLKRFGKPTNDGRMDGSAYRERSKLEVLLGADVWEQIHDRIVLDFGCGTGDDAIQMAQRGARRVIGIDLQQRFLDVARANAAKAGVADRCEFATATDERAEIIVSLDAFEHFEDPDAILRLMGTLLAAGGRILISFGPTWFHPLGGHLFSVFPWAHLLFTEKALIRWRSDFKNDGATRFGEVAGGLNQMTIRRFERIVAQSPFRFEHFEPIPIRRLAPVANRFTREWTTAVVRCTLVARA
jgi:SAM-dependent methyltransferase